MWSEGARWCHGHQTDDLMDRDCRANRRFTAGCRLQQAEGPLQCLYWRSRWGLCLCTVTWFEQHNQNPICDLLHVKCVWKTKLNLMRIESNMHQWKAGIKTKKDKVITTSMYHLKQELWLVGDILVAIARPFCLPSTWEGPLNTGTFWGGKRNKNMLDTLYRSTNIEH